MPTANATQGDNSKESVQGSSSVEVAQPVNSSANANPVLAANTGNSGTSVHHSAAHVHGPSHPASPGPNFGEVLIAIQAMPEKIVQALKEAAPKMTQSPTAQSVSQTEAAVKTTQSVTQDVSRTPGKSRSFAEWWFGRG